jgi:DNA-directed RNA polymerase subunit RPC12/RpoP
MSYKNFWKLGFDKMRTVNLNCPNCGAPLNINNDQGQIVDCPFCGSKVVLEGNLVERNLQDIKPERQGTEPATQAQNGVINSFFWQTLSKGGANNVWALASLVTGIIGIGGFMILPALCLPLSLMGLIAGIVGVKSSNRRIAISGIVLNCIALLLHIALIVLAVSTTLFRS